MSIFWETIRIHQTSNSDESQVENVAWNTGCLWNAKSKSWAAVRAQVGSPGDRLSTSCWIIPSKDPGLPVAIGTLIFAETWGKRFPEFPTNEPAMFFCKTCGTWWIPWFHLSSVMFILEIPLKLICMTLHPIWISSWLHSLSIQNETISAFNQDALNGILHKSRAPVPLRLMLLLLSIELV